MLVVFFVLLAPILVAIPTVVAENSNGGEIQPQALYNAKMYFEPYSVGTYQKTIAYGETYNGPVPPSPVFMWYYALLIDGRLAKPKVIATNLPSQPEIVYHGDCTVIPGGAWEIVQTGWAAVAPITVWAKLETYATSSGTYVGKAGAGPEHGGTFWDYWATGYLYVN